MTLPDEYAAGYIAIAEAVLQSRDWKESLNQVLSEVRALFIFDNLALYLFQKEQDPLTIAYARAVGRGQHAEADAAWGQEVAAQVMETGETVVRIFPMPRKTRSLDRLSYPFLLGLPLRTPDGVVGSLVFVRFGGPDYTSEDTQRARFIASQFACLFERKFLLEQIGSLYEARRTLALQQDFIATISHELRTPLGFIKGYSTTLLRQDTQWDEATRREFLTIIEEESDRLNALLNNMLESARLQSNTLPMNLQPVRLDAVIRDAALRAQARYPLLQIQTTLSPGPFIRADATRIAQVIENLIGNAIKYAPGAPIHIALQHQDGWQTIHFTDQGPGVEPENLPYLFERFYRVPGREASGSGLGLFICKKIIEAHGGQICAESRPGVGLTFIIRLPALTE